MTTKIKNLVLYTLFTALSACGGGNDSTGKSNTNKEDTQGIGNVMFQVSIDMTWSAQTHPTNFPGGPHFTEFVGATHNSNVVFWQLGEFATPGIELMAERGDITELSTEINNSVQAGNSKSRILLNMISPSPGVSTGTIAVSDSHTLFTLVSMQAPSPDWFVGLNSYELKPNGIWLDKKVIDLFVYDSGTDDGPDYISNDDDSIPAQIITKLTTPPFIINGTVIPLGTITIERINL